MIRPAVLHGALPLALAAPALAGCVAAAAIPVVAGGLVAKGQVFGGKDDASERQGTVVEDPSRVPVFAPGTEPKSSLAPTAATLGDVPAGPASPSAAPVAAARTSAPAVPGPRRQKHRQGRDKLEVVPLTALPAPSAAATPTDAYAAFTAYAIAQAPPPPPDRPRRSALVDQASITKSARTLDCADQPPAVLIDLDPGKAVFDLDNPPHAAEGLAADLTSIRAAGMTVLWIAGLPASASDRLQNTLAATLLDPAKADKLLLLSGKDDTKQQRRMAAARNWCIVAIAGDRRGDFDEFYDYLKAPDAPSVSMLETEIGSGWFLVPPPID